MTQVHPGFDVLDGGTYQSFIIHWAPIKQAPTTYQTW